MRKIALYLLLLTVVPGMLRAQHEPPLCTRQCQCTEPCSDECPCYHPEKPETAEVRNVIYMIGDGMGTAQITAMMLERGYGPTVFDRAQAVGLVKTHSANNRVTDSAAGGTALATGAKTCNGRIGIDPEGRPLEGIMSKAARHGYRTGIAVTITLQHATPAAFYGHVFDRDQYDSIAVQLAGSGIDVAMGGGRKYFEERSDGRNLSNEMRSRGYKVVHSLREAADVDNGRLVVLTDDDHMPYRREGRGDYLPQAVSKSLQLLSSGPAPGKGFMLIVEGSLIDYAGHAASIEDVKAEVADFADAVTVAFDYADTHPGTLVVVLADHETGGLSINSAGDDFTASDSGLKYSFSTDDHSATMIPMFAYGTGAEHFTGVFDNTDIPKIIEKLLLGTHR